VREASSAAVTVVRLFAMMGDDRITMREHAGASGAYPSMASRGDGTIRTDDSPSHGERQRGRLAARSEGEVVMIIGAARRTGRTISRPARLAVALLLVGCTASPPAQPLSPSPIPSFSGAGTPTAAASASPNAAPRATASASGTASLDPWLQDLKQLDRAVRILHPMPFANTDEAIWNKAIADLSQTLPTASHDEQIVGLRRLVSLLDTHSDFIAPVSLYDVLVYRFSDGMFVVRASDPALVGSRLVSINGHPVDEVETAIRTLIPADNESGKLDGLWILPTVEYLHGLGIVDDPTKPGFRFEAADGTQQTVDLGAMEIDPWNAAFDVIGDLLGDAPEAVSRRNVAVWTRLDAATKTFIVSYNDYTEAGLPPALQAMTTALDSGAATRVLLDMRYLRGGNGSLAFPLIEALKADARINRRGRLIVMIGRENVSAGTVVASRLDLETEAILVGEMTPARANNFLCECAEIVLKNSGYIVSVPRQRSGNADPRLAIEPDIPFALTSADFFAGKDPALVAALALPIDGTTP
jgi:hypothetical protein